LRILNHAVQYTTQGGRMQGEAEPGLRFRPWSRGLLQRRP
jgi:hypothetical protein